MLRGNTNPKNCMLDVDILTNDCSVYLYYIESPRSMHPILCNRMITQQPRRKRDGKDRDARFLLMQIDRESNNGGERNVTRTVRWTLPAEG